MPQHVDNVTPQRLTTSPDSGEWTGANYADWFEVVYRAAHARRRRPPLRIARLADYVIARRRR